MKDVNLKFWRLNWGHMEILSHGGYFDRLRYRWEGIAGGIPPEASSRSFPQHYLHRLIFQ